MSREELEGLFEQGLTLREIGERIGRTSSAVGKMAQRLGVVPPGRARYGPRVIDRDELTALVDAGATEGSLAGHFGVTVTTIRRHLTRHGLRTHRTARLQEGRAAGTSDAPLLECRRHGLVAHRRDADGGLRCPRCASEAVGRRRRKVKATLVQEAGGCCEICGYCQYVGALEFHHRDPAAKSFSLSYAGVTRSLERARAEAAKCILLCANCHAEVEAGLVRPGDPG